MIVVSDSSPIIFFAKIDRLDILEKLYKKVYIPNKVYEEITFKENLEDVIKIQNCDFLIREIVNTDDIAKIRNKDNIIIHPGEEAAIALALKKNCDCFIADDGDAKKIAHNNNITIIGTIGLIAGLRENNLISKEIEKDYLMLLKEKGFYMDDIIIDKVINKKFSKEELENMKKAIPPLESIQDLNEKVIKEEQLKNTNNKDNTKSDEKDIGDDEDPKH